MSQAKIEKRARRDLYEGSKLLDAHRKQVCYPPARIIRAITIDRYRLANVRGDVYEGLRLISCSQHLFI